MKHAIFALVFIITFSAHAGNVSFVPESNCPAGNICCPKSLKCSYYGGCDSLPGWEQSSLSSQKFEGIKTVSFAGASLDNTLDGKKYKSLICSYRDGEVDGSTFWIQLKLSNGKLFTPAIDSNWNYQFMKKYAWCAINSSSTCRVSASNK